VGTRTIRKTLFPPRPVRNLKNYDAHLLVKQFHRKYTEHVTRHGTLTYDDVKVIPLNGEKYLHFEIGELRFLDSFQFLSTSLDQLVSLLLKVGKDKSVHTKRHLGADDDLIFSKGIFPYNYITGPEKFPETQLPPICFFFMTS